MWPGTVGLGRTVTTLTGIRRLRVMAQLGGLLFQRDTVSGMPKQALDLRLRDVPSDRLDQAIALTTTIERIRNWVRDVDVFGLQPEVAFDTLLSPYADEPPPSGKGGVIDLRLLNQAAVAPVWPDKLINVEYLDDGGRGWLLHSFARHAPRWWVQAATNELHQQTPAGLAVLINLGVPLIGELRPEVWLAGTELVRRIDRDLRHGTGDPPEVN